MKQFIHDLYMMPEFFRGKRLGQIWLEPVKDGAKEWKCLPGSNKLNSASDAYKRLHMLARSFFSMGIALMVSAGAMMIIQLAHV